MCENLQLPWLRKPVEERTERHSEMSELRPGAP